MCFFTVKVNITKVGKAEESFLAGSSLREGWQHDGLGMRTCMQVRMERR
jgi:hypothetical protein